MGLLALAVSVHRQTMQQCNDNAYARRRTALKALFLDRGLRATCTLRLSTTDLALAQQWLDWTAAGVERLCFKRLDRAHRLVRTRRKYKVRATTEAIFPVKSLCSA
ncbi:hypothetical protein SALBM135S_05645 [Streptomyces alboniger]